MEKGDRGQKTQVGLSGHKNTVTFYLSMEKQQQGSRWEKV